jgi:soluble lytic murein transglycosylase-like protein
MPRREAPWWRHAERSFRVAEPRSLRHILASIKIHWAILKLFEAIRMSSRIRASILAAGFAVAPLAALAEGEPINLRDAGPTTATVESEAPALETQAPAATGRRARAGAGPLSFDGEAASGVRALIARYAVTHGVPGALADAVARIESRYNPRAANAGNFGLMQIRLQTARGEGYAGSAQGLLDADTNANFGVKHLARAYRLANGDTCGAVMRYQSGLAATRMSGANRSYCARVKAIIGARVATAS